MPRSKRAQHDLVAAARIAERSHGFRPVELSRVRFEPANRQIHVADGSGVARLRRLAEFDGGNDNTVGREHLINAGVIGAIPVVPRAAMNIDNHWKRARPFGTINAQRPRLAV